MVILIACVFRGAAKKPRFFCVCKSLIVGVMYFFLKKVAKRFGENATLYISLQHITIYNKTK